LKYRISLLITLFIFSISAYSTEAPPHHSKYVGQEKRTIKSLSNDDVDQLKHGKGWGLAKAAELNGMPGPSHILQMKTEISLSKEQEAQIQSLFEDMESKAIPLGIKLIELEKQLNTAFADKTITEENLNQQLNSISHVRKQLRYVHLVTHLQTPKILSQQQIEKYNRIRGYASGDPCSNIPKGHNADMWKKHNDCN